jgi:hypothetical protein
MRLMRMQARQPINSERASGGMTPESARMLSQLRMNYLNPGAGWIGNDAVGGGSVFGGYYRGAPMDSYYGVPPNVGNISMMRGDAPAMNTSPSAALARLFGNNGPSWSAANWLSDLQNPNNPNATNPYGAERPGNWITGEQIGNQYHGGGAGMLDFLRGPYGQGGMDSMFSGEGRGGGSDPTLMTAEQLV